MPIKKSAIKALKQSEKKYVFNLRTKRAMKDLVKKTRQFIDGNDMDNAKKTLQQAIKGIDKAVKKKIIKKNTASRQVSRLTKAVGRIRK